MHSLVFSITQTRRNRQWWPTCRKLFCMCVCVTANMCIHACISTLYTVCVPACVLICTHHFLCMCVPILRRQNIIKPSWEELGFCRKITTANTAKVDDVTVLDMFITRQLVSFNHCNSLLVQWLAYIIFILETFSSLHHYSFIFLFFAKHFMELACNSLWQSNIQTSHSWKLQIFHK